MTCPSEIQLTRDIVPHAGPLHALRVKDDSILDALVNDGDMAALERTAVRQYP